MPQRMQLLLEGVECIERAEETSLAAAMLTRHVALEVRAATLVLLVRTAVRGSAALSWRKMMDDIVGAFLGLNPETDES